MGKLIVFNMLTADGYFEGPEGEINWHQVDEEVNEFTVTQLKAASILLFGRKTYLMMESFWPDAEAFKQHPVIAKLMNDYLKVAFSATLRQTNWNNVKVINENAIEEVKRLKRQSEKDLLVFGSAHLCSSLTDHNLVEEFRLMINPVVLGKGRPLFRKKLSLQLLKIRAFGNGNVLLCYRPGR